MIPYQESALPECEIASEDGRKTCYTLVTDARTSCFQLRLTVWVKYMLSEIGQTNLNLIMSQALIKSEFQFRSQVQLALNRFLPDGAKLTNMHVYG